MIGIGIRMWRGNGEVGGSAAVLLFILLFFSLPAVAAVKLPALISDNMVLQQNTQSHLWGWADPGEHIQITIAKREFKTTADETGSWQFYLPQLPLGMHELNIHSTSIFGDTSSISIKNVAVGEVWLASGQSNMAWPLKHSADATTTIAAANHPPIRFFRVARRAALSPQQDVEGRWEVISPETAADISAVAYHFARRTQRELEVPLGIIEAMSNGSKVAAWTGLPALQALPSLQPLITELDQQRYPAAEDKTSAWDAAKNFNTPTVLYNAMIAPLHAYTLQGVIWYQGESDVHHPRQYRDVFPAMIHQWRQGWQKQLPFLFVQLANFEFAIGSKRQTWSELRESQAVTQASVATTGMVTAIDAGEADNVHPPNKTVVGERLAGWALARVYGRDVAYQGPEYESYTRQLSPSGGQQIRVQFSTAQGLQSRGEISAFELAGADGVYHQARASVEGTTIVLQAKQAAEPSWLRYAWRNNPVANVYNGDDLPLKPFKLQLW